jgi:hypothetical protein
MTEVESQQPVYTTQPGAASSLDRSIYTVYVVPAFAPEQAATQTSEAGEAVATTCACVGLAFSWIPIVGCCNFCLNLGAPRGSPRAMFGSISCLIASIVFIFMILFFPIYYYVL